MLFTEPTFLFLFLPVLLGLYYVTPELPVSPKLARSGSEGGKLGPTYARMHGPANWLLVIASVIFYAKGGGSFTWLILASIAFNYRMAIAVDRARDTRPRRAKLILLAAVAVNLTVLGIFKYANFFLSNVNAVLGAFGSNGFAVADVLLPIGISFFTFHAISYVVDVYRRDASAQKSPVDAALYLLLFPQLIAGPIIRYRDIADQLARRVSTLDDFALGVRRFVIGLGKKVLIANTVALPADRIFQMPAEQLSFGHAWLGVLCYTLQIYFDFSGYSDMAIGLGRMFGFRFPENFRWPYIADSVQDFWRRWHISLSTWFRDYLYVPLGGNRVGPVRTYLNLVTVFFLCGLWHGASWTFVVWGVFHGMFLVIERLGASRRVFQGDSTLRGALRHAYTLLVVMIGWVFFRADTLTFAFAYLKSMAGLGTAAPTAFSLSWYLTPEMWLALAAGAIGSLPVVPAIARWAENPAKAGSHDRSGSDNRRWLPGFEAAAIVALAAILVVSIMQVAARSYSPFIYFRF
jgi:alginate O-acetyltransferase complex protein AlgI